MTVRQAYLYRKMKPISQQHFDIIELLYKAMEGFEDLKNEDEQIKRRYKECPLDKETLQYVSHVFKVRYQKVEKELQKRLRVTGGELK